MSRARDPHRGTVRAKIGKNLAVFYGILTEHICAVGIRTKFVVYYGKTTTGSADGGFVGAHYGIHNTRSSRVSLGGDREDLATTTEDGRGLYPL
jgi:hypothetical protein